MSLRFLVLAMVVATAVGCSAGRRSEAEAGTDAGQDADQQPPTDADLAPDAPSDVGSPDADAPPVPTCGDGVVDEGEECDDSNRLDGDGCTWDCRVGAGDPPPDPDPSVSPYAVEGAPTDMGGDPIGASSIRLLPLEWSGRDHATVFGQMTDLSDPPLLAALVFRRFDESGAVLDTDEAYGAGFSGLQGWDLVWTGTEHGLFYNVCEIERAAGRLELLRLDARGKPLADPVIVMEWSDECPRSPAIAWDGEGYVMLYGLESSARGPDCRGVYDTRREDIWALRTDALGHRDGLPDPVLVAEDAQPSSQPDVAVGTDGILVTIVAATAELGGACDQHALWVSRDLGRVVPSGALSDTNGGEVVYGHERFIVAWARGGDEPGEGQACVARFLDDGRLEAAPACTAVPPEVVISRWAPSGLAAGDGGLGLVLGGELCPEGPELECQRTHFFLRTDAFGRAIGSVQPITVPSTVGSGTARLGPYAIDWTGESFGVLMEHADPDAHHRMMLARIVRAP